MKRWILILVACFCLALPLMPGCDQTTPAQRIAFVQQTVSQATALSKSISATTEELKAVISTSELMLADPNVPAEFKPQILSNLNLAKMKLDTFLAKKQEVDNILARCDKILQSADINNATVTSEVQTYGQAVQAIAPSLPPPWNAYAYLLGGLAVPGIGLIASVINGMKKTKTIQNLGTEVALAQQETNDLKFVFTDTVSSVKTLLDPTKNEGAIPADKIKLAKTILEKAQDGETQNAVDDVLNPQVNTGPTI